MFRVSGRGGRHASQRRRPVPRRAAAVGLSAAALIVLGRLLVRWRRCTASTPLTPRQALLAAASHAQQVTSASETLTVRDSGAQNTTTTGAIQFQRKPTLQASETLNTTVPVRAPRSR